MTTTPSLITPAAEPLTITRLRKNIALVLAKIGTRTNCRCGAEVYYVLETRLGRPLIVDDELGLHRCKTEGKI